MRQIKSRAGSTKNTRGFSHLIWQAFHLQKRDIENKIRNFDNINSRINHYNHLLWHNFFLVKNFPLPKKGKIIKQCLFIKMNIIMNSSHLPLILLKSGMANHSKMIGKSFWIIITHIIFLLSSHLFSFSFVDLLNIEDDRWHLTHNSTKKSKSNGLKCAISLNTSRAC